MSEDERPAPSVEERAKILRALKEEEEKMWQGIRALPNDWMWGVPENRQRKKDE
jgi:hypothetical protein